MEKLCEARRTRHVYRVVLESHKPAAENLALDPGPVQQEQCVDRLPVVSLYQHTPAKSLAPFLFVGTGLLHEQLGVSEGRDFLSQKAKDVGLAVQVREVLNAHVEQSLWRLGQLLLHCQLGRHDVLVQLDLALEVVARWHVVSLLPLQRVLF